MLPTRTKVWRPDLADTLGGDRVGWVAPPGHYPTQVGTDFLDAVENPNPVTTVLTDPPDSSGNWVVVWWQPGRYAWEYVPWLEVLEYPSHE
ncbi:hypothetical protein ACWDUL_28215 [Nocardia niigatensis]